MTAEPITIFSPAIDPNEVIHTVRKFVSNVSVQTQDESWSEIVVSVGWPWKRKKLVLTHSPSYYSGKSWDAQMDSMRGYLSRFPDCTQKLAAIRMTENFGFAVGASFSPDCSRVDARFALVGEIVLATNGVIFTPSSLRDAFGRVLFSADYSEIDPMAVWPSYALG